ncbi:hypothetical protein WKI71_25470 [Streptomyces sp. MS1.AVA.1]|uniref:Uncharacterized protein n=1 Tax=Streptomyces machairae TaxID=3134109 RepID=A0ABU8UPP6_9ACTN
MTATHHLNTPDLFALSEIHGPVLRPGEDGYAEEVTGFNLAALHTPTWSWVRRTSTTS